MRRAERHAGEPERFPYELVDTGNYYTRFSPDRKDKAFGKEELSIVNGELMALLEYHLMLTLGFDDETALTNVQRRLRNR
ncbi:HEPN domain-containing protein [Trueperella pyogenes]|uniref:HEPN domain-containing protein n=1 Tax=Trueperella pyogenes TaxID=1661 RepID=UPI00345DB0A7